MQTRPIANCERPLYLTLRPPAPPPGDALDPTTKQRNGSPAADASLALRRPAYACARHFCRGGWRVVPDTWIYDAGGHSHPAAVAGGDVCEPVVHVRAGAHAG